MLTRRIVAGTPFTRRDAARLAVAASILVAIMTGILSIGIMPAGFSADVGDLAPTDLRAPSQADFTSDIETKAARDAARKAVLPQYDYSAERGELFAARQLATFRRTVAPVDAAFAAVLTPSARRAALAAALPRLSSASKQTLQALDRASWDGLKAEMERVLQDAQRQEVRDTNLPGIRQALAERVSDLFAADQRALASEILPPLLVANSSFDQQKTVEAQARAVNAVDPVRRVIKRGELIVEKDHALTPTDIEAMSKLGLLDPQLDPGKLAGWLGLSALAVGLLLAWVWRFRAEFWHRNNALLLVGLLLVGTVLALKVTGDRSVLPYFVPTAAAGLLIAILLSTGAAIVLMGVLAVFASVITGQVEMGAYVFLGGFAGVIAIRRGERLGNFIQAALAMAVVNLAVVTIYGLLGEHDLAAFLQLGGAALAAAGGSALAAAGSFALVGNLFGITTSFQLLELASPSQPLLRRLLVETPGTYHHSIIVGNLAERAAEVIGADALLTRVGAYYHDVGKLANPLAFIENQAGMENVHDELSPEASAAVLKAHVANGIDLAYRYRLPKPVIAFIPQHHGTALMSYFLVKAREQAIEAAGAPPGSSQAQEAAASIDENRFRHAGPKPQTREAAVLMLADSVEASVRSLTSHDEPAIRGMVQRIFRERLEDGQFDECDLTFRDLERTREAFVGQLLGMYHRRIEYPQNKIVELESRRAASSGRRRFRRTRDSGVG
jgi:putative nucleotidyltransferase with HDIG domain